MYIVRFETTTVMRLDYQLLTIDCIDKVQNRFRNEHKSYKLFCTRLRDKCYGKAP